ncbi:MAG: hypothetical protein KGL39_22155 [Patescibacteria group bacterium]|nr:hypothetical protein [Patescibacteria group bacterium]
MPDTELILERLRALQEKFETSQATINATLGKIEAHLAKLNGKVAEVEMWRSAADVKLPAMEHAIASNLERLLEHNRTNLLTLEGLRHELSQHQSFIDGAASMRDEFKEVKEKVDRHASFLSHAKGGHWTMKEVGMWLALLAAAASGAANLWVAFHK